MTHQESNVELARADLCRFVAACYYEPAPEFVEDGLFDSMLAAARTAGASLVMPAQRLREAFCADALQDLLVDYTRLFLGPTEILAQPYGSWWLTGEKTLMQDTTMAILALYREGGFEMDEDFRELPDHIAAELEFLYLLRWRAWDARSTGALDAADAAEGLRQRLVDEHLARWIPPFAAALKAAAATDFYRHLATVTDALVAMEQS